MGTQIETTVSTAQSHEGHESRATLGYFLCWAVVFADIGTSVYYTPGILFNQDGIGKKAAFFVFLTLIVFFLLALKYIEVSYRYPEGGGVVTVAARSMSRWVGALGGMFILVDYFLTASISSLSGVQYLGGIAHQLSQIDPQLILTLILLVLLGLLNWWGISESAKVSAIGAVISFLSNLAVLGTVLLHVPLSRLLGTFGEMFQGGKPLTGAVLLTGYAGAFLAFSGLESISQLSPVMRSPRKKTASKAMLFVAISIAITSPFLTLWSTTLLNAATVNPNNFISELGGAYGGDLLRAETALAAAGLLVFASNTAIIGAYHVFLALARMGFFPKFIEKRGKWRGTPHYSILVATGVPILVLIAVHGNINILGDMYAFGLLGAFSVTCIGLDIVRWRERKDDKKRRNEPHITYADTHHQIVEDHLPAKPANLLLFTVGIITTILVVLAWSVNLVAKPLATEFGGGVTLFGLAIAGVNYWHLQRQGRYAVTPMRFFIPRLRGSVLAVLEPSGAHNEDVIRAAISEARSSNSPVVLFYNGKPPQVSQRALFEIVDPYLEDEEAQHTFAKAEALAKKYKGLKRSYIYRIGDNQVISDVWQKLQPDVLVLEQHDGTKTAGVSADSVRYTLTDGPRIVRYSKHWEKVS